MFMLTTSSNVNCFSYYIIDFQFVEKLKIYNYSNLLTVKDY